MTKRTRVYQLVTNCLKVEGTLWDGRKATNEYRIPEGKEIESLSDVRSLAGDFQSIKTATKVLTESTVNEKIIRCKLF